MTAWLESLDRLSQTLSFDDLVDIPDGNKHQTSIETRIALNQALAKLTPKERVVIKRRYVLGQSQTETAQAMNLSHQRISQLETAAISKLQSLLS